MNQSDPPPAIETAAILAFLHSRPRPVTLKALVQHFDLGAEQRGRLKRWLDEQIARGELRRVKKSLYSAVPAGDSNLVSGRLATHRDGYGFVIPDMPGATDIFIPPNSLGEAVHGDRVQVRVTHKRRGRAEGQVIRVVTRSQQQVVGKLLRHGRQWMVTPLDERYHYTIRLAEVSPGLREGEIVTVRIVAQPRRQELPVGEIAAVLGFPDDPEIQFKIVCHKNQIPMGFPEEVLSEAAKIDPPAERQVRLREDLRDHLIVTIDGETARDFDDAVSIERHGDGFVLGVHIADVSHYVQPGSAIDTEAFLRGTSVYFPDRAIPMLPERLSSDICSLKPGEDRLTLSVFMTVDREGRVRRHRFARSVIRSRARMTYTAVSGILSGSDPGLLARYQHLAEQFRLMRELSQILASRRRARGAVDFDLPRPKSNTTCAGTSLTLCAASEMRLTASSKSSCCWPTRPLRQTWAVIARR